MYEKYLGQRINKEGLKKLCDTGEEVAFYTKMIEGEESLLLGKIVSSKKATSQYQLTSLKSIYGVETDMFFETSYDGRTMYSIIPEGSIYRKRRNHRNAFDDASNLSTKCTISSSDAKDNYLKITDLEEKILLGMIGLSDENNICKATLTDITKEAGLNMVGGIYTYVVRSLVFQGYLEKLNNGYRILDK